MKVLLLTCGLIVTIMSVLSVLYNLITADYENRNPDTVWNVLTVITMTTGLVLIVSSTQGSFTGVHDTRSDIYIITDIEEQFNKGQFIAKYKANSYDTENRINRTSVEIQFYDALQKFHVGDTLKLVK